MGAIRVRVCYRGRVQGVGFRATAYRIAERYAVSGWVRNDPEGSVTLVVEGFPEEVNAMIDDLARTMSGHIQGADRQVSAPEGETGFEVRR